MKHTLSDEQWCAKALEAAQLIDLQIISLENLGCFLAAAHMSHAVDALEQDMKARDCGFIILRFG